MDLRKAGYHWGKKEIKTDTYEQFLINQIVSGKIKFSEVRSTLLFYKQKAKFNRIRQIIKKLDVTLLKI